MHRASFAKPSGSIKHEEKLKFPPLSFSIKRIQPTLPNKKNSSTALREIAREKTKIDDKQLNKETAEKTINPYYFTDKILQIALGYLELI